MHPLVVTPHEQHYMIRPLVELLKERFAFEIPRLMDWENLELDLKKQNDVFPIVLLHESQPEQTLSIIRHLQSQGYEHILVIGPAKDPKLILRIIQCGAEMFLDEADIATDLNLALDRITLGSHTGKRETQILAFLSTAGGCGSSTLAVNTAVLLAKEYGRSHLIDLNPGKADLAPMLDLKPSFTLSDLSRNEERFDRSMYEKILTNHTSGVQLLAAPQSHDEVSMFTPEAVLRAISLARETFTDIIVDLDNCYHTEQMAVLEQSTTIFLVARSDFTTIRNTRRILDDLILQGIPKERIKIVLNQVGRTNELPIQDVEIAIGCKVAESIAYDAERNNWSNNTGIPSVIRDPEAVFCIDVARLIHIKREISRKPSHVSQFVVRINRFLGSCWKWIRSKWKKPVIPFPENTIIDNATVIEEMSPRHEPNLSTRNERPDPRTCAA